MQLQHSGERTLLTLWLSSHFVWSGIGCRSRPRCITVLVLVLVQEPKKKQKSLLLEVGEMDEEDFRVKI